MRNVLFRLPSASQKCACLSSLSSELLGVLLYRGIFVTLVCLISTRLWGLPSLPRVLGDKRHRPKIAKNVSTILFQNTDSQQNLTEKKRQFATATIHKRYLFTLLFRQWHDRPGQHDSKSSLLCKLKDILNKPSFNTWRTCYAVCVLRLLFPFLVQRSTRCHVSHDFL